MTKTRAQSDTEYLLSKTGARLLAYMMNKSRTSEVTQWLNAETPPDIVEANQLRVIARVTRTFDSSREYSGMSGTMLQTMNPALGGKAIAEVIRAGDFGKAQDAAEAVAFSDPMGI